MDTSYVVSQIGTRDISQGTKGNKKLAKFICQSLELNGRNIFKIESWGLCCQ
jgi:hypothetical protein